MDQSTEPNTFVLSFFSKNEGMVFSPYSKEETLSRIEKEMLETFGPDGVLEVTLREPTEEELRELAELRSQTEDLEDLESDDENSNVVPMKKTLH